MNNLPVPTFDNTYLSQPNVPTVVQRDRRSDNDFLDAQIEDYLRASVSLNTRRAYRSDLVDFFNWGGTIPSAPEDIARYLADRARTLSPYTLERRLIAIARAHRAKNLDSPCSHRLVHATLRGIRRLKGMAQRRVAPLTVEELPKLLSVIPYSQRGIRDRALLLVGFAGAFRRSELVAIQVRHVRFVKEGMLISVPRSKTDQEGVGRCVAIPNGWSLMCPVTSMQNWLQSASIGNGYVFRNIEGSPEKSHLSITPASVALIIKRYVRIAGLDPTQFSGHSLRAGLVTSAARAGVSLVKIRQQTGHCSDSMVQRYIREANMFVGNAAEALFSDTTETAFVST